MNKTSLKIFIALATFTLGTVFVWFIGIKPFLKIGQQPVEEPSGSSFIKLLMPGEFQHDEDVLAINGEKWFAVYRKRPVIYPSSHESKLKEVTLSVSSDTSSKANINIGTDDIDSREEVVFFIKGLGLSTGELETNYVETKYPPSLKNYVNCDIKVTKTRYHLCIESSDPSKAYLSDDAKLILIKGEMSQVLFDGGGYPQDFDNHSVKIIWVGDLDRDGKTDLLIDISKSPASSNPTLFLSSYAKDGELVAPVAAFESYVAD